MSSNLADTLSHCHPDNPAFDLRSPVRREGTHGPAVQAAPPPQGQTALDTLPWFEPSAMRPQVARGAGADARTERLRLMLNAGFVAAVTAFLAGAWLLWDDPAAQPEALEQQAQLMAARTTEAWIAAVDTATGTGPEAAPAEALAAAPPAPDASRPIAAPAPAPGASGRTAQDAARIADRSPARTAGIMASPAAAPAGAPQKAAAPDASPTIAPVSPAADRPATPATLKEFRAALDEGRRTIREVIRLGDRQRPGKNASAEEQTRYRLRQQNAEAARNYRAYLDTLARSVRRWNSEDGTRQSLERARQTLGYVTAMLADSKASLR